MIRRRQTTALVRRIDSLLVEGVRRRGSSRKTWEKQMWLDLKALKLNETMTANMCSWRRLNRVVDFLLGSGPVVESLRVEGHLREVKLSSIIAEWVNRGIVKSFLDKSHVDNHGRR
ncbi:hypothetical protein OROGR_012719 [Orobanche gracilis]